MTPALVACWSLVLLAANFPSVRGDSDVKTHREGHLDHAPTLDKPLLAIQLGSIVAAYVIFVAILLALLLLVGQRLRQTVQSSNYSLQMEMLRPVKQTVSMDPSPISPMSQNIPSPSKSGFTMSWGSLAKGAKVSHPSTNHSVVTVDESVVASDRQRAQDEMEKLYAAVMEYDEQKASGADVSMKEPDSSPDSNYTNPFTDRASRVPEPPSVSPLKSPRTSSRLSRLFTSNSSPRPGGEQNKLRSPRLSNIRKAQISSPLASPEMVASPKSFYTQDQPPLSPRIYNPGPPPQAPRASAVVQFQNPYAGRARPPAPLNLATAAQPSSSTSLPFREAYPPQSAPATKTTILDRPTKHRNGPMTGMPTPYSPYMPFTPVTPFTPGRTVNKKQRKREEKENGLRVLIEDDLVKDDNDMWG
ncbi:hypothetical protein N7474_009259 [Penicillium riverlandense]|uniref:uncharacterized protein n=1 Tax=Penicillium riverlandense TaxID=1903569 RepID=UPI002548936B|nr:uncharacterized protein N7474_009259 [Penicillium riverlandense]KAJ5807990.1 hypothetical protein N7474_009259 [Penicillium riverlandense]